MLWLACIFQGLDGHRTDSCVFCGLQHKTDPLVNGLCATLLQLEQRWRVVIYSSIRNDLENNINHLDFFFLST